MQTDPYGDIIRDTDDLQRRGYRAIAQSIKAARNVAVEEGDDATLEQLASDTARVLSLVQEAARWA